MAQLNSQGPPIHYLIADRTGNAVVVELINNGIQIVRDENPWRVSTNFIISEEKPQGADAQCDRYRLLYSSLEQAQGTIASSDAWELLKNVSQESTIWSAVYNTITGDIQIVMGQAWDNKHDFSLDIISDS